VPIYEQRVAPLLDYAGIAADVTVTDHAGHAIEIGKAYDPGRYEGAIFIGGDGTVQEFLSGLLSRMDWRTVVRRTPLCSIACGTQNALARGVRTPLPEYATVRGRRGGRRTAPLAARKHIVRRQAPGSTLFAVRFLLATRSLLPQWCVIKHKIRPLDAMLVSNNAGLRTVSLCGVGFGLAADVGASRGEPVGPT
jgi:hypothetical protein